MRTPERFKTGETLKKDIGWKLNLLVDFVKSLVPHGDSSTVFVKHTGNGSFFSAKRGGGGGGGGAGEVYDGYFKITNTSTDEEPYKLTVSFGRVQINDIQFEINEADIVLSEADFPAEEEAEGYPATFIYLDFDYDASTGIASNPTVEYTESDGAFPQDDADSIMILLAIAKWTPADEENPARITDIIQQNYGMIYKVDPAYRGCFAVRKQTDDTISVSAGIAQVNISIFDVEAAEFSITGNTYVYLESVLSGNEPAVPVLKTDATMPGCTNGYFRQILAYVTWDSEDEKILSIVQHSYGIIHGLAWKTCNE